MDDDDSRRVQLPLRMRAGLHGRLLAAAQKNDLSLNLEITQRLQRGLDDEEHGLQLFRDEDNRIMCEVLLRLLRGCEIRAKKRWTKDPKILVEALRIYQRTLELSPVLFGKVPEKLRDAADYAALRFIEELIEGERARQAESREDETAAAESRRGEGAGRGFA
jgi:hypothetical protein